MQDKRKDFDKIARKLIREEKLVFTRLKDTLRKYRLMLPFISGNAERLEGKIARLMSNCEESEKSLRGKKSQIAVSSSKTMEMEKKLLVLESSRRVLIARYNSMLAGKPTTGQLFAPVTSSIPELMDKREKFLSKISSEFSLIENELKRLDQHREKLVQNKAAVEKKIAKKRGRAAIIDNKVALYQAEIRGRLKELNSQVRNEKCLTAEYSTLIAKLKETPDLSNWPVSMVREAIRHSHPRAQIIDLRNPMTGDSLPAT
jgi:chromosome segregation ATPase